MLMLLLLMLLLMTDTLKEDSSYLMNGANRLQTRLSGE